MSDGTSGHSPAEDEIDRQLRELTEGTAGEPRFREPSAAERAKVARQRARNARQNARAAGKHTPADGWRGAYRNDLSVRQARRHARRARKQAARACRRASRRRRALRATSWTVVLAVLGGAAWLGYQHVRHSGSTVAGRAAGALNGTFVNGVSQPTSTGPGPDPFARTPADHWADGAAGITVPIPNPIGPFTATQVADAYGTTRKLLIAQTLDPTTLRGGAPTAYEKLLNPVERKWFISGLSKNGLEKNGATTNTRGLLTSFAPGTTALIGSVIKVHGTMRAQLGTDHGKQVLYVDVNYRMVYPVEPPRDPAGWMRIVTMDYGHVEFGDWDNPAYGAPLEPVTDFMISPSGGKCGMADGYVHPDFPSGPPDTIQPSGAPVDPYSMRVPDITTTCGTTTGT